MAKFRDEPAVTPTGWTRWVQPISKGYKMVCCDCGLVHNVDFRVRKGRAELRMQRNNRSTAMARRWKRNTTGEVSDGN